MFVLQSIVVGLAVAFLVVLVRPDLMPGVAAPNGGPASYADAVDRSAAAVANIYTKRLVQDRDAAGEQTRFRIDTSFASAVVIDPEGYLVTNFHVVADATEIRVQLSDGRLTEPEIIGLDAETDLALLRLDLGEVPAIHLGSSASLRIGDVVLAIGNPYGLTTSVTQGIVSATGRGLLNLVTFENFIQTDAAINAGNSGGALVNSRGELVGINTAVLAQDPGTEGIGFAIPVDLVRGVVEQIRQHGRVIRGYMGLLPDDLTNAERAALGIEGGVGILLVEVYEGGPAAKAGLKEGDVILAMNGEPVYSQRQALLISASTAPGNSVEVVGLRDGTRFSASITAGERPGDPR
ncbi:MAG TPA: trypsin-like peptidase domain-containing protein [Woeseiaceae bacterium]